MCKKKQAEFAHYIDKRTKNEFVIIAKGHCYIEDHEKYNSKSDLIIDSMMWSIIMNLEKKDDYFIVPIEKEDIVFPHVKGEIGSSKLAHGGCTVWFIAGPVFEEALKEG